MISKSTLKVEFRSVFRCQNVEACEMLVDVLKVICHSNEIYIMSPRSQTTYISLSSVDSMTSYYRKCLYSCVAS